MATKQLFNTEEGLRSLREELDFLKNHKRQEVKELIKSLKKDNPNIEKNIFNSIHHLHLDTFPAYKTKGEMHTFLENYDETETENGQPLSED